MAIKLIAKDEAQVFIPEGERGSRYPFKVTTKVMTYGQYTKFLDSMPVKMRKRKTSTESAGAIASLWADRVVKIENFFGEDGKRASTEDPKLIRSIYYQLPPDIGNEWYEWITGVSSLSEDDEKN